MKTFVLWAVRKGKPSWQEEIITETSDAAKLVKAKRWAKQNGFSKFRLMEYIEGEQPDFAKTVKTGLGGEGKCRCP